MCVGKFNIYFFLICVSNLLLLYCTVFIRAVLEFLRNIHLNRSHSTFTSRFAISFSPALTMTSEFCYKEIRDRVVLIRSSFMAIAQILIAAMSWGVLSQDWSYRLFNGYIGLCEQISHFDRFWRTRKFRLLIWSIASVPISKYEKLKAILTYRIHNVWFRS